MSRSPAIAHQRIKLLQRDLLDWYDEMRRRLPWREQPGLFGIWISEIMLQQTTVKAVIPYWHRFLARFPDVSTLASASEEELLQLWSGLGYYRRARLLHQAARLVVEERGGRLPRSRDEWLQLPGVGAYTAGAIASIALGEKVPAVDANVRRVLTRWLCRSHREAVLLKTAPLAKVAAELVDTRRPGDWNQAIMELGSIVCHSLAPVCRDCPVADFCRAHEAGAVAEIPPSVAKGAPIPVALSALIVRRGPSLLLLPASHTPRLRMQHWGAPVRRDVSSLWQGLWGVPLSSWYAAPSAETESAKRGDMTRSAQIAWSSWLAALADYEPQTWSHLGRVTHAVTTYKLRIWITSVTTVGTFAFLDGMRWYRPGNRDNPPLSALARKILEHSGCL